MKEGNRSRQMHSRKERARSRQSTRLDDGALHAIRGKRVEDAVDITIALDADAVVSTRLGETVVRCRLTRSHARILNGRAIEAFAILKKDLIVREDFDAPIDNDRVKLEGEVRSCAGVNRKLSECGICV